MRALIVVWRFLVDLIIGDDPKIAFAVLAALGATLAVLLAEVVPVSAVPAVGAALIVAAFTVSLIVDTRSRPVEKMGP